MYLSLAGTKILVIRSFNYLLTFFISGTNISSISTVHRVITLPHTLNNLLIVFTIEGWSSCDQNVEDNSHRPNITSLIVISLQNFRSNVVGLHKKYGLLFQLIYFIFWLWVLCSCFPSIERIGRNQWLWGRDCPWPWRENFQVLDHDGLPFKCGNN